MEARDEDGGEEEDDVSQLIGKVGAKKQRKLQEKAEKKAMREVSVPCASHDHPMVLFAGILSKKKRREKTERKEKP